jgi:SAM-dependent methyltransferase
MPPPSASRGGSDFAGRLRRFLSEPWRDRVDWKYNADTGGTIQMAQLEVDAPNVRFATCYRATLGWVIRRFLRRLPADLARCSFVDFGSGKGRALLVAAEFPFERIVGVEFCGALHDIAQRNIAGLPQPMRPEGRVRSVLQDVTAFALPQTNLVGYLYNPFGPPVLDEVAARLAAHRRRGFEVHVIYINPKHRDVFEHDGRFRVIDSHKKGVTYRAV